MDTLDKVIMFLGCVIEVFLLFDYFYNFFPIKERWTKKNVWAIAIGVCLTLFLINLFKNGFLNLIFIPILLWSFVWIVFEAKISVKLGYFIIAYAVMIGVEFLYLIMSETTLALVARTGLVPFSQYIWQLVFIKFLNYLVFAVLKQTSSKSKKRLSNKMFAAYMCLPICTIGCMITIFYSGVDFSGNFAPKLLMTIFFVFMLFGNIFVFYAFQKYTEGLALESENQVEIMHQKAEIYRLNQITEMNDNYKEIVHNTSHFLKVIGEMAAENQNQEIYDLVKKIDKSFEKNVVTVYSNYKIVDTLLAENETKAKQKGVTFDVYIEQGTNLDNISEVDMISMLGNLLDNAVTAASKKEKDSLVKVRIFMQNEGNICVVKIVNDFVEDLVEEGGKLLTTKKDGGLHGLGISSVNRTAEKYNGFLEHYVENNQFISVLVLPTAS